MGNLRFLPVPDVDGTKIAAVQDNQELADWLQSLPANQLENSSKQICCLLNQLNETPMEAGSRIQQLELVNTYLSLFESRIETNYLDAPFPLADSLQRCLEWLVWSYWRLAQGYWMAAQKTKARKTEVICLYRAFKALTQVYLHTSAVYFEPPDGFWRLCYQLYAKTEEENLLESEVADEEENGTINRLFKTLLIFSLSDLQQFRAREMHKVYAFLGQFSDHLAMSKSVSPDELKVAFVFDLEEDSPPASSTKLMEIPQSSTIRFFVSSGLTKIVCQAVQHDHGQTGLLKAVNKTLLKRLMKTLNQNQVRQYKRLEGRDQCRGIVGFAGIRDFLYQNSTAPTSSAKPELPKNIKPYDYDTSQFELVAEGEEMIVQMDADLKKKGARDQKLSRILAASGSLNEKINVWGGKNDPDQQKVSVTVNEFEVLNCSAKGYSVVINSDKTQLRVGDLFAVVDESGKAMELAIIRRVQRIAENRLNLGVELIGIAQDVVLLMSKGDSSRRTKAIFMPGIKALNQPDSLVYNSAEFKVGEFVSVRKNGQDIPGRLNKLINSTASFSQAELFYLS